MLALEINLINGNLSVGVDVGVGVGVGVEEFVDGKSLLNLHMVHLN
jgi:hypothetical protein